jgi:hypothetical protein
MNYTMSMKIIRTILINLTTSNLSVAKKLKFTCRFFSVIPHYRIFYIDSRKMPNPKLFLYKARDAPIVAILRRGSVKTDWQLIRWNTETDEFTEGQWLTKAVMNGAYCSISPDGRYFAYHYSSLREENRWKSYAVVSEIPYFTASLIAKSHVGMWDAIAFRNDGLLMHTRAQQGFVMKRQINIAISPVYDSSLIYNGLGEAFTDMRGRVVSVVGAAIHVDGLVIYDTTDHVFQQVVCPTEELADSTIILPSAV